MAEDIEAIRVGIDSAPAERGAERFDRSMQRMSKAAILMARDLRKARDEFNRVGTASKTAADSANRSSAVWDKLRSSVLRLGAAYLGLNTGIRIVKSVINNQIEFESQLVRVGKTTDLVGEDLKVLGERFLVLGTQMSTPTLEMLEIAEAAGRLGVRGVDDLTQFSQTMALLAQTTDIAGEEGATNIARLLSLVGEAPSQVFPLGNAIALVGDNIAGTESEIVKMATELAKLTGSFGLSSTEIVGMSGALVEMGQQAELVRTQIGRTFIEINSAILEGGEAAQDLADLLGLTSDELRDAFSEDALGIFIKFVEALRDIRDEGGDFVRTLERFGISGARVAAVYLPLINRVDGLGRAMALAERGAAEGTKLLADQEQQSKTTQSALDRLANSWTAFSNAVAGSGLVQDLAKGAANILDNVSGVSRSEFEESEGIRAARELAKLRSEIGVDRASATDPTITNLEEVNANLREQLSLLTELGRVTQRQIGTVTRDPFAPGRIGNRTPREVADLLGFDFEGSSATVLATELQQQLFPLIDEVERKIAQSGQQPTVEIPAAIRVRVEAASVDDTFGPQLPTAQDESDTRFRLAQEQFAGVAEAQQRIDILRSENDILAALPEHRAELIAKQELMLGGITEEHAMYQQILGDLTDQIKLSDDLNEKEFIRLEIVQRIAGAMTDLVFSIGKEGQKASDIIRQLTEDLGRLAAQRAFEELVGQIIPRSGGGGDSPDISIEEATGDAFMSGRVVPFAGGGVVSEPTLFPMSGGRTGLMGEAGEEAIMPLRRLPNGRLGVESVGGGDSSRRVVEDRRQFVTHLHVHGVRDVDGFKRNERQITRRLQDAQRKGV